MTNSQAWLYAAICAGLFAVTWKMPSPKWIWVVKPFFALLAAAFFAQTSWGGPAADLLLWPLDLVGGWFGVSGALIATGLAVIAIVVAVRDVAVDHVANTPAIVALALLPLLAQIAVGPVGDLLEKGTDRVAVAGSSGFERLIEGEG